VLDAYSRARWSRCHVGCGGQRPSRSSGGRTGGDRPSRGPSGAVEAGCRDRAEGAGHARTTRARGMPFITVQSYPAPRRKAMFGAGFQMHKAKYGQPITLGGGALLATATTSVHPLNDRKRCRRQQRSGHARQQCHPSRQRRRDGPDAPGRRFRGRRFELTPTCVSGGTRRGRDAKRRRGALAPAVAQPTVEQPAARCDSTRLVDSRRRARWRLESRSRRTAASSSRTRTWPVF